MLACSFCVEKNVKSLERWVTVPSLPEHGLSVADLICDVALTDPEGQAGPVASASFASFPKLIQCL